MKRILAIFVLTAFTVVFVSCKKSNDGNGKTKTELLTQASWKFDKATASGFGDISSQLPSCKKDDIITFSSNNTGVADEGATKCNTGDPQATNFNWNFLSNETVLHLSVVLFSGGSSDFNIVSLTETNLVLSQVMNVSPFGNTTVEVTFKH